MSQRPRALSVAATSQQQNSTTTDFNNIDSPIVSPPKAIPQRARAQTTVVSNNTSGTAPKIEGIPRSYLNSSIAFLFTKPLPPPPKDYEPGKYYKIEPTVKPAPPAPPLVSSLPNVAGTFNAPSAVPWIPFSELKKVPFRPTYLPDFKPTPVLERPWAIQRVILFTVGKWSGFSLEKMHRLASVCQAWDETVWELGTSSIILPPDFIKDAAVTAGIIQPQPPQPVFNRWGLPSVPQQQQRLPRAKICIDQQEFLAEESKEIFDRCLQSRKTIKHTKRLRWFRSQKMQQCSHLLQICHHCESLSSHLSRHSSHCLPTR
jgi:hypothetical protein